MCVFCFSLLLHPTPLTLHPDNIFVFNFSSFSFFSFFSLISFQWDRAWESTAKAWGWGSFSFQSVNMIFSLLIEIVTYNISETRAGFVGRVGPSDYDRQCVVLGFIPTLDIIPTLYKLYCYKKLKPSLQLTWSMSLYFLLHLT